MTVKIGNFVTILLISDQDIWSFNWALRCRKFLYEFVLVQNMTIFITSRISPKLLEDFLDQDCLKGKNC